MLASQREDTKWRERNSHGRDFWFCNGVVDDMENVMPQAVGCRGNGVPKEDMVPQETIDPILCYHGKLYAWMLGKPREGRQQGGGIEHE